MSHPSRARTAETLGREHVLGAPTLEHVPERIRPALEAAAT
ncbi:MAG TPA: hypothetical protein VFR26_00225 [Acidimicrobiales bacterium]|nr:hypothetical protein [Acidimicrobiales bacterium]